MIKQLTALVALAACSLAAAEDDRFARAKAAIQSLAPGVEITQVSEAPIPGFVEVLIGPDVLYVSEDGRYLVQGQIFDVTAKRDLTEASRAVVRGEQLATVSEKDQLRYGPNGPDHDVWVFTDIDCGYCRRLHEQMAEYNDLGIRVNYLMYPRAGIGSESFDKAVSVWCAADPHQALTDAKAGRDPEPKQCDNPIQAHFELGQRVGVSGTPAIITKSGHQLGGYLPPAQLRQKLDEFES